jgi:hypothetical protein
VHGYKEVQMASSSKGRRREVRDRRRRRQDAVEAQLVFGFLRERGRRRVQRSTENERIEVVA